MKNQTYLGKNATYQQNRKSWQRKCMLYFLALQKENRKKFTSDESFDTFTLSIQLSGAGAVPVATCGFRVSADNQNFRVPK